MKYLIPLAIGAVLLIVSQSKSETKSTSKKEESSSDKNIILQGTIVKTSKSKEEDTKLEFIPVCDSNTQYWDAKSEKCITFWFPGETDDLVRQSLEEEIRKAYKVPNIGPAFIPTLCEDTKNNKGWINNERNSIIITNTIFKIWPKIPANSVPPKINDPQWIKTIWKKIQNIHIQIACENK